MGFHASIVAGLLFLSAISCTRVAPDAGHEAVLIQKPWFFGHGGVLPEPVPSGATWVAWSTAQGPPDQVRWRLCASL